jgi:multidrug efflux pump subunit AcrA (membrane-fusion protein)
MIFSRQLAAAICWLIGLPLVISASPLYAQPAANVVVAKVVQENVSASSSFVATVRPRRRVTIGSAVDGRVFERNVEEGDRIKAGQPLIQLLTNTIELELKAAEAELRLRESELVELRNGTRVSEIEQAKAKMLAAEADTDLARSQLDRLQRLKDSSAISQGDLDRARAAFDQRTQLYLDLKSAYELAIEGPRSEKIDQAEAILGMQAARVEQIKDRINKYTIVSRFDGFVSQQMVETGAWVKTGDPIMEVIDLEEVELETYVAEQHIAFIRPGLEVTVEIPALPGQTFPGKVKSVVPQADPESRTFPVIVRVANQIDDSNGPLLKAGYYARVVLPTGDSQQAMMVPKDAIVLGGPQPMVYVVIPGAESSTVAPVPVELGLSEGGRFQVSGDLKPGQQVVVEGNERLRPGQSVVVTNQ